MKKLAICALSAFMIFMLCACSGAESSAKMTLADVYADIKAQVTLSEMNQLESVESLDRYYGITADSVDEFAGGINNSGVEQEEIVLIKAKDNASANSIKTALENRYNAKLNENKNYNPQQAEMIEKCKVEQNGLYVSMIVSDNAEKITEVYKTDLGL